MAESTMQLSDQDYERFDLVSASNIISQGMAQDGLHVEASDIADQMLVCLTVRNHYGRVTRKGESILVPVASLFDQYDLWVIRIAALTDIFMDQDEVKAGGWPGKALPGTEAALRKIKQIVFGLIETQSGLLNPEDGVTVLDIITRSLVTGESLAQCRSRALYDTRGLRVALQPKPRQRSMRNRFNA
ncbi:hypothetical protein QAO71_17145 (plasmid) [Halopseudomonas sp. SMJS2]|uniref:hypothetical protein n=1 Tax=Halopseudomonas sp. SMJS2 TaxID=3041098 RepID=UPI002452CB72|nr:hypothetical protein [Halopseudomonas sp. SMJS2]WGK63495.1 hypothetical protein QAO71_17145 [Halopseudomonas sp. SMJS2]